MIVYNKKLAPSWGDYGILIPLLDNRSELVFDSLRKRGHALFETKLTDLPLLTRHDLELAHKPAFVQNLFSKKIYNEFIDCFELANDSGERHRYNPDLAKKELSDFMEETLLHTAGTCYSMELSLEKEEMFCFFLGGGMHHARSDKGAGFCLVNDIVVGVRRLQKQKKIQNCWVIDVDAHKGDGTAEITRGDHDCLTLSIHMEKGWPLDIPDLNHPSKIPSNIDINMNEKNQEQYNQLLEEGLNQLLQVMGSSPDFIVVNNGADPYEFDELQSTRFLNLDKETLLKRDQLIYQFAKHRNIPQCWLMSGGYGRRSYEIYVQFLDWVLNHSKK